MGQELSQSVSEELNLLQRWIRRKVFICSVQCFVTGMAFCSLGLANIAVTSIPAALLLFRVSSLFPLTGTSINLPRLPILVAIVLLIAVLSFWEAWRNPYGLGSFRHAVHLRDRVSGGMFRAFATLISDLFLGGPRMTLSGIDSFWECGQLLRTSRNDAAEVLLWMVKRNHKVPVEQLLNAFPSVNFVRLLPQLCLLNGFIWLPTRSGICLLSSELKSEMHSFLHLESQSFEEPETPSPQYEGPFSEEQQWF